MSAKRDYWRNSIIIGADSCNLVLSKDEIDALATSVENAFEHYSDAFYLSPPDERTKCIENEWKAKLKALEAERDAEIKVKEADFAAYRRRAQILIQQVIDAKLRPE